MHSALTAMYQKWVFTLALSLPMFAAAQQRRLPPPPDPQRPTLDKVVVIDNLPENGSKTYPTGKNSVQLSIGASTPAPSRLQVRYNNKVLLQQTGAKRRRDTFTLQLTQAKNKLVFTGAGIGDTMLQQSIILKIPPEVHMTLLLSPGTADTVYILKKNRKK